MRFLLLIIFIISGCNSSKRTVVRNQNGKFLYYSGNISGIDYILVHKKVNGKKQYTLTIDCNHYITGIGYTYFLKKTLYSQSENNFSTYYLIKDTSMLPKLNLTKNINNNYLKLSDEEYEVVKTSFSKYPALTA